MHKEGGIATEVVAAARAGDEEARDQLIAGYMPLVLPPHGFAAHGPLTGGLTAPTGQPAPGSNATAPTAAHPAGAASELHTGAPQAPHQRSAGGPHYGGTGRPDPGTRRGARRRVIYGAQLAEVVAVAVLGVTRALPDQVGPPQAAGPASIPTSGIPTPGIDAAPAVPPPVETPTSPASPAASPPPSSAPTTTPTATPAPPDLERQLVDLINAKRARNGCRPLHVDPKLHTAAQQHSQDMAAHHYFDHVDRQGGHADSRITAAGYQWSAWGENLDRNRTAPADVLNDWMDGAIHEQNMLDCRFTDAGVGTAPTTSGPLWTLDLAAPS